MQPVPEKSRALARAKLGFQTISGGDETASGKYGLTAKDERGFGVTRRRLTVGPGFGDQAAVLGKLMTDGGVNW